MRVNHFSFLKQSALLFLLLLSFSKISIGQTEVQIIVNGPWDFVEDPGDKDKKRVVVIAPVAMESHMTAQIFAGNNPVFFPGKPSLLPGLYRIEIPGLQNSGNPPKLPKEEQPAAFPVLVSDIDGVIKPAIQKPDGKRFAFSLPKPLYYSTYKSDRNLYAKRQSKLSTKDKLKTSSLPGDYTVVMVLHYVVKQPVAPALLTGTSDDQSVTWNGSVKFLNAPTIGSPAAIVIAMAAKDDKGGHLCDAYSMDSLKQSRALFNLTLFGHFPQVSMNGQIRGKFNAECLDDQFVETQNKRREGLTESLQSVQLFRDFVRNPSAQSARDARENLKKIRKNMPLIFEERMPKFIDTELDIAGKLIDRLIVKPVKDADALAQKVLIRTDGVISATAAGSSDCNKAQLNINGVIN
jgi:hypothetical protein